MAELTFWTSFAFILYVYFGYPLLLVVWHRLARQPVRKAYWEPFVSLVVAAHNEKDHIERKVLNCLQIDYTRDKLQIIVSLDGPTDGTDTIVQRLAAGHEIDVVSSPNRQGKASALNRAVAKARGEILVLTDARQWLDSHAVRELVANFHDTSVGAVTGELILLDETAGEARDGVGLYWRYEKRLRAMESDIHSMLGATGAIYAVRRELFRELRQETILDDVIIPMNTVLVGKRVIFDPTARAYDMVCTPAVEYGRKVRTLMGNFQLLAQMPELVLPWRNPVCLQFLSHKIGRLLVPYFLLALFISNLFLIHSFYAVFLVLQTAWYLLAWAGSLVSSEPTKKASLGSLSPDYSSITAETQRTLRGRRGFWLEPRARERKSL